MTPLPGWTRRTDKSTDEVYADVKQVRMRWNDRWYSTLDRTFNVLQDIWRINTESVCYRKTNLRKNVSNEQVPIFWLLFKLLQGYSEN